MKLSLALVLVAALSGCGKKAEQPPAPPPPVPHDASKPVVVADAGSAAAAASDAAGSAAADDNPRESPICTQVIQKILECAKDPKFVEALDEGVDAKRKANDKKYLKQIVGWHYDNCAELPPAIEEEGFLLPSRWPDVVNAVTNANALATCGGLGTALNSSGLFGGDVAN